MARSLSPGTGWVVAQMSVLALQAAVPFLFRLSLSPWSVLAGGLVLVVAVALALWSGWRLGSSLTPLPKPKDDSRLVVQGPYRFVRHPIYSALILLSAGWSLLWGSWVLVLLSVVLVVVFVFKTRLEERWLLQRYPEYADYRGRTGRLFPRFGRRA